MTARRFPRRVCPVCRNDFRVRGDGGLIRHRMRTRQGYILDWCRGGSAPIPRSTRTVQCASCGEQRPHNGLRLCGPCYRGHRAAGTLEQFEHYRTGAGAAAAARRIERLPQVLALVAHGMANEQIGRALGICIETVKSDLKMINRTFGTRTRAHAVAAAIRKGVIVVRQGVLVPAPEVDVDATALQLARVVRDVLQLGNGRRTA